tara:strand:- start:111 stop:518 length:408 start_codon:yes stop_codon:yes gene_type:complete
MNVYKDSKQEIRVEGDLYIPVISDESYKAIAVEVSKELKLLAREILNLLKKSQRDDYKFFEDIFESIIKSLDELENFRETIEHCHRLGYRRPLEATLTYQSYTECKEIYDKLEEIDKKWEKVSTNGWLAARAVAH